MKVLLCHSHYQQPGGEDQVFADEGRLLEAHGHQVLRYTLHNDALAGMGRLTAAVKTVWNSQAAAEIGALVRSERPDIAHFTNTFPLISPAAYYAARRAGAAVVQSLHNYRLLCPSAVFLREGRICEDCLGRAFAWPGVLHGCYRASRAATGIVATMQAMHRAAGSWRRGVDRYIALTEFARQKFVEGGLPAERISVKGNFVDPDPGLGASDGGFALFVGRLSPEKGIDTLLDAWRRLPGKRLVILGDGPLAAQVQAAAAANPNVQWLGHRPRTEALAWIGRAACVIVPSRWYEMFGLVVIEAFARGAVVVASQLGALGELVEHERTGLHFDAGDAAALAHNVARLFDDGVLRAACRMAARAEYERRCSAAGNYEELCAVYYQARAQYELSAPRRTGKRRIPNDMRASHEAPL